jgi:hypothetical protein
MPFNLLELIEKDVDIEKEFEKYLSKMKLWICELLREKTSPFLLVFFILKVFFSFENQVVKTSFETYTNTWRTNWKPFSQNKNPGAQFLKF